MKKLHVDNYPSIYDWCKANLNKNDFECYPDNITIFCKDIQQKNEYIKEIDKVRTGKKLIEIDESMLTALRNYFGNNDKTMFQHNAFNLFDRAIKGWYDK